MIERVQGNLLKADTEALVNTVNTVGVMGKGIALQFKKAFPETMPNATTRPAMTPGRAAVLKIMDRYLVPLWGYRLSLLETQKLAYLAQESGQPLRLTFVKHHYGPYADTLRHVLNRIEGHFVTGFGAGESKPDTPLSLLPGAVEEATSFLEREGDQQTAARIDRVARLIEGFETPHGMELLTTVHWSATRDVEPRADLDTVTRAVHAWSPRKKKLFPAEQIESAWKQLVEQGWLEAATDPAA